MKVILDRAIQYEKEEKLDSALIFLDLITQNANLQDHPGLIASAYIRMGTIMCITHKPRIGKAYFRKALEYGLLLEKPKTIGKSLLGIGSAFYYLEKLDSSLYYFEQALDPLEKVKDWTDLIGAYNNIGFIYFHSDQTAKALNYYHKAIELSLKSGDTINAAEAYLNIALLFKEKEDYEQATSYLNLSKKASINGGFSHIRYKIERELGKINYIKGLYKEAVEQYFLYDSLASTHLNSDYSDKILELETKFRTAEIERDNAVKQARIELQERRMLFLSSIAGFLALAMLGVYVYNEQRKKIMRALAFQKEQENNKRIEDLLNQQELQSAYAMLAGQEKAYKRVAEELHDNLGSILVTLNMFADTLQKKTDPVAQKELAKKISDVAQIANEATRTISHSLNSGALKHFGLASAVQELIDALNESQSISVVSHIQVQNTLDSEISLNVYRIIQELINNTLKHSGASRINIELTQINDQLSLIFEDNGIGFNPNADRTGIGLRNLESRVERLNGDLTIDSQPEKGTTIIIEVLIS